MEFSHEDALGLIQSQEEFPVDFDSCWKWIGYSTKQKAKNKLFNNFEESLDYIILLTHLVKQKGRGGHNREEIKLSIDCFKSLGMMAGTEKGKEVRRYFLKCEQIAKQAVEIIPAQTQELEKLRLQVELAKAQEGAAAAQKQLMASCQTLALINPALPALVMGKTDTLPPEKVVVEKTVLVDSRSKKPVAIHEGISKTKLSKRYGMRKPQDLVNWLKSLGKEDVLESGLIAAPCQYVRWEKVQELDRLWSSSRGVRQKLLGE